MKTYADKQRKRAFYKRLKRWKDKMRDDFNPQPKPEKLPPIHAMLRTDKTAWESIGSRERYEELCGVKYYNGKL